MIYNNLSRLFLLCKVDWTCAKQCSEFFKWSSNGRSISSCKMSETDFSLHLSLSTLFSCISSYLTTLQLFLIQWMDIVCACYVCVWALSSNLHHLHFCYCRWPRQVLRSIFILYWTVSARWCILFYFYFKLRTVFMWKGNLRWSRTEVEQHI